MRIKKQISREYHLESKWYEIAAITISFSLTHNKAQLLGNVFSRVALELLKIKYHFRQTMLVKVKIRFDPYYFKTSTSRFTAENDHMMVMDSKTVTIFTFRARRLRNFN